MSVCMCVTVGINSVAYGPVDKLIPPSILPKEQEGRKQGCNGGTTILLQLYTHKTHSYPCMTGRVEATHTQCQPLWSQASPTGPSGSYSSLGRWGWLVLLCNFSLVSDTVQVCPLWPRLPRDCVNSPPNLRKYPVGIFLKPVSVKGLVFHLESYW